METHTEPAAAVQAPARADSLPGQEDDRRPGPAAGADVRRAPGARPPARRGRSRAGQDDGGQDAGAGRSAASSSGSSSRPTWCRPTSSAPASTTSATGEFQVSLGPVFANLLLADEINRAPAKVQSALLEVMQERQVTIGRETYPAPDPFLVMATQNPIESEGTYPLPEAQVDRFMLKVLVGYPTPAEEYVVVERMTSAPRSPPRSSTRRRCWATSGPRTRCTSTPRSSSYAVRLSTATRDLAAVGLPELARYVSFGASPRASINMVLGAKALAFLRGRDYALPVGRPRPGPRRTAPPHRALLRGTRRRRLARRPARAGARRRPGARDPAGRAQPRSPMAGHGPHQRP